MPGTTAGGKKAAETRGHDRLAEAGRKGGEHSHGSQAGSKGAKNNNNDNNNNNEEDEGGLGSRGK